MESVQMEKRTRGNYLGPQLMMQLHMICSPINMIFGDYGCYLVGSCLYKKDYRDVDIRFIMQDNKFDQMFPNYRSDCVHPTLAFLNLLVSSWITQQTRLNIDFQFQRMSNANLEYPQREDNERQFLGVEYKLDTSGECP